MATSVSGSQITFSDLSTQNTAASGFGFHNRIINGAMGIWQRGTSFTNTANTAQYTADRWDVFSGVGLPATSGQVASGLQNFPYALRVQRPNGNTATTNYVALQVIETANCRDLAGQSITVSFLARAGANYSQSGSLLSVYIGTGTGTDQGSTSWINGAWTGLANSAQNVTLTTTMTQYSLTYSVPTGTNEIVLAFVVYPTGTAGAADYFDITGVQLEKGPTATAFDYRPYGTELMLCQRYYYPLGYTRFSGTQASGTSIVFPINFPVSMRVTPTGTLNSVVTNANYVANPTTASQWGFVQSGIGYPTKTGTVSIYANANTQDVGYLAFIGATYSTSFNQIVLGGGSGDIATFSAEL